ncbi:collagen-like protein [Aquimarina atlantica]|nr:collagen-like protein [Aquimarina atlantica]
MTSIVRGIIMLFLSVIIFSCSDGEDGAIGPAGQNGIDGINGQDGQDGTDGQPGTANVIYSDWIPTGFENFINNSNADFTINAPDMTDAIIESGAILVYGKNIGNLNDEDTYAIPVVLTNTHFFTAEAAGQLELRIRSLDGDIIGDPFFEEYRYILIPGGIPVNQSVGTKSAKDYATMSYREAISLFNIPE